MSHWIWAAAGMLAASVEPPAAPPTSVSEPAELPKPATLPTTEPSLLPPDDIVEGRTDYYDRMTVPVTISGEGPFRFMIDTGAQATVITRGLSEKLKLPTIGSAVVVGMGSREDVELVQLDGLEFADRTLGDIAAPLLEARNVGADGILGLDSLQDMRVMIDFRSQTIAVNDASALGGNSGYEIIVRARRKLGRLIIANATIDGVRTAVVIDTGAQSSFGNLKLQKRLRGARNRVEVSSQDVNGAVIIGKRHYAKRFQIQGLQLNNMPITFAESPAFAALGLSERPAIIMGMRDLRLFNRVAIDFEKRQVLFDLPTGSKNHRGVRQQFQATRL
ncbi:retroviral-like aspartic protease family protein [Pontixanthobacter aquaemixtae]|uniref:Peptidase A2 domain-containing protein n=1 Tax=Pontixanthobacter aquaemixtae TaxID=1958940 RepID=A0A844ZQP3_9SPHN|nr:retroviral-like aspartic protease family protein [Pontixanthobacter aquaemixtae]MXO89346.1 hypothetical protein [Pontixanthobacter aquaemixtae]